MDMGVKSKKGTQKKGIIGARAWPDLPQQLVQLIARQPELMHNISGFGGVTKSWRATPRKCNQRGKSQWPQLIDNSQEHPDKAQVPCNLSISFRQGCIPWYRSWHRPPPCVYPEEDFVGYSHGALVVRGDCASYRFWDPVQIRTRYLPLWDENEVPSRFVALSSSQLDFKNCVVMALSAGGSGFMFCRLARQGPGEYKWVRQDITIVDPYGSEQSTMKVSNVIGFEGKFYILSVQGSLAVIEDTNETQLTITALGKNRAVPSIPCKHFREYLVQSCGEILLVLLISRRTVNIVDHVEVFRLNFTKISWVKMTSLGEDRTLFAGVNCCMSVKASKTGCRRNCIYFSPLTVESWLVYDMESDCIAPNCDPPSEFPLWDEQEIFE